MIDAKGYDELRQAIIERDRGEQAVRDFFRKHIFGVVIFDLKKFVFIAVNDTFASWLDYHPLDFKDQQMDKFVYPDDLASNYAEGKRNVVNRKNLDPFETRYMTKDGDPVLLRWTGWNDFETMTSFCVVEKIQDGD